MGCCQKKKITKEIIDETIINDSLVPDNRISHLPPRRQFCYTFAEVPHLYLCGCAACFRSSGLSRSCYEKGGRNYLEVTWRSLCITASGKR